MLAEPLRAWVYRRFGVNSKAATLADCPWCLSIWVAVPVVATAWLAGDTAWFQIPAAILTVSYAYGLLAQTLDGDQ